MSRSTCEAAVRTLSTLYWNSGSVFSSLPRAWRAGLLASRLWWSAGSWTGLHESAHWCLLVQERQPGREWGLVMGAARLGEGASIGFGFWMTAHGGAVRTHGLKRVKTRTAM